MYLMNVRIVNIGGKMSRVKTPARPAPTIESEVIKMIEGKTYFSNPTQIRIENPDADSGWSYGIGYQYVFICACCGGVFELEALNEDGLAIEPIGNWVDFSEFIH